MPTIVIRDAAGAVHRIDASNGSNLMVEARAHSVAGIIGECGGCLNCGSCHIHVDPEWIDRLPPASDDEWSLIEGLLECSAESRLACQLELDDAMDGLSCTVPGPA
ncbi:MAG TPA: 2Fe-2S iron-sulfur cluster-binding protein [Sphingobium sp.]|nr:2Fe-2S iron-sulfur cluster-binding protein [Sphingobium sp.]